MKEGILTDPQIRSAIKMRATVLFLMLTMACSAPVTSDNTAVTTRDSAGITIIEYSHAAVAEVPVWQLGDLLTTLGGKDSDEIHDMTGAEVGILEDTGFLIGDQANMQLRRFNSSGELLGTAAGRGAGPGELLYLGTLFHAADGPAVVDFSRGVLALYGDSLQFMRQVDLRDLPGGQRTGVFAIDHDGTLYTIGGPRTRREPSATGQIIRDPQVVERLVSENGPVDTFFTLPSSEFYYIEGGTRGRRFAMGSFIHRTIQGFVSAEGEHWEVAYRDSAGSVRHLLRLNWPRRPVTEPMRAAQLQLDHKEIDELPEGGFKGIRRMAEVDFADPHFPDSLPPYGASRLGLDGTLWLREGLAPTDSLKHWFVFHGDTLLAKLELPVSLVLLDAKRDRLLLRRTDSLDLGYVELYSIKTAP